MIKNTLFYETREMWKMKKERVNVLCIWISSFDCVTSEERYERCLF